MPIKRDTMCMCGPDTDRNSDYKEPHRTISKLLFPDENEHAFLRKHSEIFQNLFCSSTKTLFNIFVCL